LNFNILKINYQYFKKYLLQYKLFIINIYNLYIAKYLFIVNFNYDITCLLKDNNLLENLTMKNKLLFYAVHILKY